MKVKRRMNYLKIPKHHSSSTGMVLIGRYSKHHSSLSLSWGKGFFEDSPNRRMVGGILFISYSLLFAVCELILYTDLVDNCDGYFTCEIGQKV